MSPSSWLVGKSLGIFLISDWCERTAQSAHPTKDGATHGHVVPDCRRNQTKQANKQQLLLQFPPLGSHLDFLACCAWMIGYAVDL